jgi:hypothetical protein
LRGFLAYVARRNADIYHIVGGSVMNVKEVQRAIGVHEDGVFGPISTRALVAQVLAGNVEVLKPVGAPVNVTIYPLTSAMIRQGSAGGGGAVIVLHCTATAPDWLKGRPLREKMDEITRWHKARGFSTIGYHWVIDRDGMYLPGRPENVIGAHVIEANRGTIGISLVGGLDGSATDQFSDHFTAEQRRTLKGLINSIRTRTQIKRITGHNEYAAKACPCFTLRNEVWDA